MAILEQLPFHQIQFARQAAIWFTASSMGEISASTRLTYSHGLWLGSIPTRYGMIELVLSGTPDSPNDDQLAAIQAFLQQAGEITAKLRHKLRFSFLWRPVRLTVNNENRVGVQFQHRLLNRRELLFADEI
jgi:hypothetical protein